jgi:predicted metal-dependent hydrolase
MNQVVQYGTNQIAFRLEYKNRSTLGIEVQPTGQVLVCAPETAPLEQIKKIIVKKAAWILRQQQELKTYPPPLSARVYVSGESYRYLGRQYRLKVLLEAPESVKLTRGFLEVRSLNQTRVEKLLKNWFRARAETIFNERMNHCLERVKAFGVLHSGEFKLKQMKQRWGSCSKSSIYLNPQLVAAPKECIDYVLIHELVHTVHWHHRKDFYALLARCCPNWQELKKQLNTLVEI